MDTILGSDGFVTSILNLGGISVPARTRFIATTLATTTYSSLTFGLFSGLVGAVTPFGPLVPFLSGCWIGYTFGVYGAWRSAKVLALRCAERYPKLLAHAMEVEFGVWVPKEYVDTPPVTSPFSGSQRSWGGGEARVDEPDTCWETCRNKYDRCDATEDGHPLARWICKGGVGRLSWAILAAQECHNSIQHLEREQMERIVEKNYKDLIDSDDS